MAVITTNLGDITLELYPEKAPETVKNFINYAESGHYNGTIFHRVINGFMIQGGGFTPEMEQKGTKPPIRNEAQNQLKNLRGTVAMARTSDLHSATSQFFINLSDNAFLNYKDATQAGYGYCVFGKVVSGMDIVDKIANVKTGNKQIYQNVPVEPVIILNVKILQKKEQPDQGK